MTETLYPHEVVVKFLNNNLFRLQSSILLFLSGFLFFNYVHFNNTILNLVIVILVFIIGWCWQRQDYEMWGIQ
jgi:putative flippase GtrA